MKLFTKREKGTVEIRKDQLLKWKLELEGIESKIETAKEYLASESDQSVGLLMIYSVAGDAKYLRYQIESYRD